MSSPNSLVTLTIRQTDGHLFVEHVNVELGIFLEWVGPPGTSAEVVFLDESPFGDVKTVVQGQQLQASKVGQFPYQCSLRQNGVIIGTDSPTDGSWGGEVEVTGKGHGRTP